MGEVSPADALEANRAGRLTDQQRRDLRGQSRGLRKFELQFAVILTILGLVIWFAEGPAKYAIVKPLIGIALLIVAGFLVVRSFLGADPLTHDVRSGSVQSVEGAITKTSVTAHSRGSSSTSYFFIVSGTKLKVSRFEYQAAPDAGIVKVYYLPHSHQLVNMERLPDRPLPPDAFKSPQVAQDIVQAMKSHDTTQVAEARAEAAALGDAMHAAVTKGATPPPDGARDPRPLAEAIVGGWDSPLMSVSFAADGTLNATMPGGRHRTGTWSIDWSGHLLSDITGPTEAWVSGDKLTVTIGGQGLTFQRVTP
jgi:hypothetical protein